MANIDVTSYQAYRKRNIKIAEEVNDLSDMKLLSLSHIFPANRLDEDKCFTKLMNDENSRNSIHDELYKDIKMPRASVEAIIHCKDTSDREQNDFKPACIMDEKIKAICSILKDNNYAIQSHSETSFMQKYLLPYLTEIFLKDRQKNIITATVDGAEENGLIPDWKLGYKVQRRQLFTFFAEVKRPNTSSKYQAESDYVKILKEMKGSIDLQIHLGVANPASFGLLVEAIGFCKLHTMNPRKMESKFGDCYICLCSSSAQEGKLGYFCGSGVKS